MAHAVLGAVTAQLNNQSAVAGGLGAGGGELAARVIAGQLFPDKKLDQLSESEKQQVSALSQLAAGLAGALVTGDTGGAVTGAQAGKNAVENNSLSGDHARESVKQIARNMKDQVRGKLGEGTLSSIVNSVIGAAADSGDAFLGAADYGADGAMALTSCAMGDSYCSQALSDLSGKNQAAADTLKALMKSDTWSAVADTVKQAYQGNQVALEATGGMLAGIILPGKKVPAGTVAPDASKAESTAAKATGGAENIATYPKLKDHLVQQNLNNIAKQDPRLAMAVKGSGTKNPNFSVGMGTAAEADRLGKIWVGDGAKLVTNQKDCPGCWASADGTRLYRPPTVKPNTPAQFNPTGVQANFQVLEVNPTTGKSVTISNGHMNINK